MFNATDDDDIIMGTTEADEIFARGGNDFVNGGAGNDTIGGAAGRDTLEGGTGNDVVFGAAGDDDVTGGAGNDNIFGGSGNDDLVGGTGNDTLTGGSGNDDLSGGSGDDVFFFAGNFGDDNISDFQFNALGNDLLVFENVSNLSIEFDTGVISGASGPENAIFDITISDGSGNSIEIDHFTSFPGFSLFTTDDFVNGLLDSISGVANISVESLGF